MGEVRDGAAGAHLTDCDTVVAAAGGTKVSTMACLPGTEVAELLLGEFDRGQESCVLRPKGVRRLQGVEALSKGVGILFQMFLSGVDRGVPLCTIADWVDGELAGEVWDMFLQVSQESLVASVDIEGMSKVSVNFKGCLLRSCNDPLAMKLEEVLVEGQELPAIVGDPQPRPQGGEGWSEVLILDAWSWLLGDDIGHEFIVGKEIFEWERSFLLEEMSQCCWLVLIEESETGKKSDTV